MLIIRSYKTGSVVEIMIISYQKSRIRETKHLSTDADSSTDTKKILLVRQNLPKKKEEKKFCAAILHPL